MTREEAINILNRRTTIPGDGFTREQINEAIDMAIQDILLGMCDLVSVWEGDRDDQAFL